jgi:ATP-dependent DNA helicase RecQ
MEKQLISMEPNRAAQLEALLREALLLDLEVSHSGNILKIGAVLGDRAFVRTGSSSSAGGLEELAGLSQGATCILGHNLIRHDLCVLRETAPSHPLLRLPVIDTLILSPITFPENPYHRLVKDYKLVKESVNDPVADARQALVVFRDEFHSLQGLSQTEPALFELLHYLLATPDNDGSDLSARGMELVFQALGAKRPSTERALALCRAALGRWACKSVPVDAALVQTAAQRLALAYVVTWLRVAGSNSVLPPWVRMEYPAVGQLIHQLREVPCTADDCGYCRRVHNAREQLRAFFEFDDFRPEPRNKAGGSLQRDIIEAGLRNESLLALLPTGGGKSLCYQLPALVRNYRRGLLTIVISPLQALMKDQVDGLVRRTGTPFAAALYGLLTPPERGDVLRGIRMGDVAVLYVSPEQLRNRSFREAIAQREIGCWVFDEAHCLSKWGHDFRPDYLYAGRFIREFSAKQGTEIPPIACFTATAKRDVREEILAYFKAETGRELALFEGGVERGNLRFQVQTVSARAKLERVHDLLSDRLGNKRAGGAIVFRATRNEAQNSAEYLKAKGWEAAHFHAGLTPSEKKRIQDEFLAGQLQVICATNAFGMGIDKEDVRLVIHGDMPGSLESYIQEAGRAGRDGQMAECLLLYDEEDCERQFRMGAFSELSRRDIAQILRSVRKAVSRDRQEVVITAGEILRDEDIQTSIDLERPDADTKVRTAISWLERAGFIQRDENVTFAFQARLLVRDLVEADAKMATLNLSLTEQSLWRAILRELMNAGTESLTVDRLALLPEFTMYAQSGAPGRKFSPEYVSAKVLKILGSMAQVGFIKRDTLLNAFVRHKVADHSRLRLDRVLRLDRKLLDMLALEAPDPEGWMSLSVRLLNQRLGDEGLDSSTDLLRALLKSLNQDGQGFAGTYGSIELRYVTRDTYRVRVKRTWTAIGELAEKRRRLASLILDVLMRKIPSETPAQADLLVEFSFEELQEAVNRDAQLRSDIKDVEAALERALMYLHEQRVIVLQHGLAVFRSAMTIRLLPDAKGEKFKTSDYQPLEHHYRERVLQVHVMNEYARCGLDRIREALSLVLAYFTVGKEEFVRRYLATKPDLLQHATTAQSYQRIVTDLANPAQLKVVTAPTDRNMLILAGPGSGKTKTVVHRCAYLLRVERVRPQSVLVCCFNRHAAVELRRRLAELAGPDARGVTVLTYHGLAMRLLGHSYAGQAGGRKSEVDFDALITDAVKLLRGETVPPGLEPDEVRERLLAGFQYILVDEYQDIDEPQYQMISAIAGRTVEDPELKLSILAVGDDDQNIYSFRGTNVEFIRRFHEDYEAEVHYLVENYRSTSYIIEAANQVIAANTDRMKTDQPIRIDRQRQMLPAGGEFGQRDALTRGKVQVISVPDGVSQAQAVIAEIGRLHALGLDDSQMAVLSKTHEELAQVRALAEVKQIPVRWFAGRTSMPPLHQIREIHRFLQRLAERRSSLMRATEMIALAGSETPSGAVNPWSRFLDRLLEAWRVESDDAELPVQEALEFFYEAGAESRQDFSYGDGVTLRTVHAAKGAEYDHVLLIGAWPLGPGRVEREEIRRAFYVGMTRARKSLAVFHRNDMQPSLPAVLTGPAVLRRSFEPPAEAGVGPVSGTWNYVMLGLEAIHLGFPGQFSAGHPIHAALAALQPGDKLQMRPQENGRFVLADFRGVSVARLSHKAEAEWANRLSGLQRIEVVAMVHRSADQESDQARRDQCQVRDWEIPLVEVAYEPPEEKDSTGSGQALGRL